MVLGTLCLEVEYGFQNQGRTSPVLVESFRSNELSAGVKRTEAAQEPSENPKGSPWCAHKQDNHTMIGTGAIYRPNHIHIPGYRGILPIVLQ